MARWALSLKKDDGVGEFINVWYKKIFLVCWVGLVKLDLVKHYRI